MNTLNGKQCRARLPWRTDEERVLRAHYPDGGAPAVREYLPWRSLASIRDRAWKMGLQVAGGWSPDEDALLRREYPKAGIAGVQLRLPARTVSAIYKRASQLGVRRHGAGAG